MKKKISILTTTRADYGLLKPLIEKLNIENNFEIKIVVTGSHLSVDHGLTYKEIEVDGFFIDKKIEILLSSDNPASISKSMGIAIISFSDYFKDLKPDLLIVLGDRFETLAVTLVAMNQKIPIAHIHGGEITEGAIDDSIRHAITKLSYLHFTSTDEYKNRVIQLGENPNRVFNVGALGVENVMNQKLLSKANLSTQLGINLSKPYAMVTFHPVTLENNLEKDQILALLEVCKNYKKLNFIFTKTNADANNKIINQFIDLYAKDNENIFVHTSLGMNKYLSSLKYCSVIIGNSSSGIIEAPSFGIPTINIGIRQKGRLQSTSVINCEPTQNEIKKALDKSLSDEFAKHAKKTRNPYGNGTTSLQIVKVIQDTILNKNLNLQKEFYNLGEK